MRSRLLVTIGLVSAVLGVACAQALTFEIPQFAAAEVNAALAVDDSQPPRAELVATAAVAEAALAQADLLPATDWELTELAAALGNDPLAVQQFVRDSVALDPYSGVLRGAHGTLAARAGSTWDKALLLAALLEANGHTTRLAYAQGTVKESQLDYPAPPLPLADTVAAQLDLERVRVRATRDFAMLQLALSEAGLSLDSAAQPATRASALEEAVWVQVLQQDGSWLDLDPQGAAVTVPAGAKTSTADALPDEHQHFVTLSVVAESLEGGVTSSQVVLEQRLPAAMAAAQQLWLYFQPDAAGLGGAIADVFEGKSYVPVLMIDGKGPIKAMQDSWERTKGSDFSILVAVLLFYGVPTLASAAAGFVFGPEDPLGIGLSQLASAVASALGVAMAVGIYGRMVGGKEEAKVFA